ncbi:type VII secretion integral membrane protein EccD, partial [Pseudonocardia sp. RS11V-5]|nr:type VII secretion integral membrane protein EccD [Pseudonocardia terrae]
PASSCVDLLLAGGTPVTAGAACAAVGVLVAPLLPRLALRLAGLPTAEDGPPPDPDLRAGLARRHLAGLVLGDAVVTAVGAVLAAAAPGPWGPLLATAVCVVLLLRARGFAEALPARALQVAGLLGGCGAAAAGTLAAPAPLRLLAALATLGALLAVLTLHNRPHGSGPVGRRTVDLAELVFTALCVPLAAAALDLFALVRGW